MARSYGKRRAQSSFSDDSPEFFKVFLSSHQLSIPPAFVKHFNGTIPETVYLIDAAGKTSPVRLQESDGRLRFTSGWQCFAIEHNLNIGEFLIFKYNGSSSFEVKIFSISGCRKGEAEGIGKTTPDVKLEQEYSKAGKTCSKCACASKGKHPKIGLEKNEAAGESSKAEKTRSKCACASKGKHPKIGLEKNEAAGESSKAEKTRSKCAYASKGKHPKIGLEKNEVAGELSKAEKIRSKCAYASKGKHPNIGLEKNESAGGSSKASRTKSQKTVRENLEENNTPEVVTRFVKSKTPHFVLSISNSSLVTVYIHKAVVRVFNIKLNPDVMIRDKKGKSWPAKIIFKGDGRMSIGTGWSDFAKSSLKKGDQCVFEFVLQSGNTCNEIRVHILRGKARMKKLSSHWYWYMHLDL